MAIPRPHRRAPAFLAIALAAILLAGAVTEVARLGWSDQDAIRRLGTSIQADFERTAKELDDIARHAASDTSLVQRAALDGAAARQLFTALSTLGAPTTAISVFSPDRHPVAWSGRPSETNRLARQLDGPANYVVSPDATGARLIRTWPILLGKSAAGGRLATVVVERALPSAGTAEASPDSFEWPTAVARVKGRMLGGTAPGPPRQPGDTFMLSVAGGPPLIACSIYPGDVAAARTRIRASTAAALLLLLGVLLAWVSLPLAAALSRNPSILAGVLRTAAALLSIIAARLCIRGATTLAGWRGELDLGRDWPAWGRDFVASPIDFLATCLAALALAAVVSAAVTALRLAMRTRRRTAESSPVGLVAFGTTQVLASSLVLGLVLGHDRVLRLMASLPGFDLVGNALTPFESDRLAVSAGLVALHATVIWAAVSVFRTASCAFRIGPGLMARSLWAGAWLMPPVTWALLVPPAGADPAPAWLLLLPAATAMALAFGAVRFAHWRRHASQSAAILALLIALSIPSFAFYPAASAHATGARRSVVQNALAPQAIRQREELQLRVRQSLSQVDRLQGLTVLTAGSVQRANGTPPTDAAFLVWSQTDLGAFRLTSAVELYGEDGSLVSRFALNLPEYASGQQRWVEPSCKWDLFEEVSPFGSEERRLLHAGRGLCAPGSSTPTGAIVIHAQLDYAALPFLSSQSPYVEFFRRARIPGLEARQGRETEFAVYGWSRRPLFESFAGVWTLDDDTFAKVYRSREPFWTRQAGAGQWWDVYLANDRSGIFALGIPTTDAMGHLVRLSELAALNTAMYLVWLLIGSVASALGLSTPGRGRELFNEIRVSYYRKLALGYVMAAVIPVLILAGLTQTYMSSQLRAGIDEAAVRTAAVAQRVVEDYGRLQERGDNVSQRLSDDILVWISRVIDEDVSVYDGAALEATSERDLFASGLLPTRTPATVYRAISLERRATFVDEERAGEFPYLVAAAPARVGGRDVILTVPLTLRQQAIEREVDALRRRILLAVVFFVLAGWAFGWWMAERVADPVRRLQRATERMARGDLDIRLARTSSNELARLMSAFSHMASEVRHHQEAAARASKLEAWADMARQVAHEIKNPLTPIQLSAEHLRRVHTDRGTPLGTVFDNCIDTILAQVRLLRQIASDFSSFASSPTPRPVAVTPAALVNEVLSSYRSGLPGHVQLRDEVSDSLPELMVDRTLAGRALANVVENALHAMPSGGTLRVDAHHASVAGWIEIVVSDTGIGMEPDALERIFEPYFSTKAIGTGLGLTIVKRNVELHGGTVRVESRVGLGTTVTLSLPTITSNK